MPSCRKRTDIDTVGANYPDHQAYLRLTLLTAKRPTELLQCVVSDLNSKAKTLLLRKMKSRVAHTIFLSNQALAIVQAQAHGKKPGDKLFVIGDNALLLDKINEHLDTNYTPKDLRKCAAGVGADFLPLHKVKMLMDHAPDSTLTTHYSNSDEAAAGAWQAVADEISRLVA
jgi:integrase